jgi:hypothetical protein
LVSDLLAGLQFRIHFVDKPVGARPRTNWHESTRNSCVIGAVTFAASTSCWVLPCTIVCCTFAYTATIMSRQGMRSVRLMIVPWPGMSFVSGPTSFMVASRASNAPFNEPALALLLSM